MPALLSALPSASAPVTVVILLPILGALLAYYVWQRRTAGSSIYHNVAQSTITLSDGHGNLSLRLRYDTCCVIDRAVVRDRQVLAPTGAASGVKVGGKWYTSRAGIRSPRVLITRNALVVSEIVFGPPHTLVHESWHFAVHKDRITWRIARTYPQEMVLDDVAFPDWNFASMKTWTGGVLGTGGVVWCKYLENPNTTYGVHTGAVTFWNRHANDALRILPRPVQSRRRPLYSTSRFSHHPSQGGTGSEFKYNATISVKQLRPKHSLSRFLGDRQDLWAPFKAPAGEQGVEISLQALNYSDTYNRGIFKGLNGDSIRELLNTVARYGVIDTKLIGANGWRTGYICLHEPFHAQIGSVLNDPKYDANYTTYLDHARDRAIAPDGRVLSRWNYGPGDAMSGTWNKHGFYEAQWGYLLDSQPDYVINVAQHFDNTGDRKWLAGHKEACERALDYLLRREVGESGLVAMKTDSRLEQRGSDWFDIVWASYENAWVNAQLFEALILWADAEETLGDLQKASSYRTFAARLKHTFNLPLEQGGFWDEKEQLYIYWRDKDGSVHGNNIFTWINFAAISAGICDDPRRRKVIIKRIEAEMEKEGLFHWPNNFQSFTEDEVSATNLPFPNYENGDIFLSWGALAIHAHALHDPELAVKYVRNVLARYEEDGLSFQRYERENQNGAGDDILAGNCMAIVGLYRHIYGIQPRPNRLFLDPHLTPELNGTQLLYNLRGQPYEIDLNTAGSSITTKGVTVEAPSPFGINTSASAVQFFSGQSKTWGLSVSPASSQALHIHIHDWRGDSTSVRRWTVSAAGREKVSHVVAGLLPGAWYTLVTSQETKTSLQADDSGHIGLSPVLPPRRRISFELMLARY